MNLLVAFHAPLDARGCGRSLYDYADLNETLLGNRSVICLRKGSIDDVPGVVRRFEARFSMLPYDDLSQLNGLLGGARVDVIFCIKSGAPDALSRAVTCCRQAVHAVFQEGDSVPHGDRFAWVSPWLAERYGGECVPPIVRPIGPVPDLRGELGIPPGAYVFGRHGGWTEFNVDFVKRAVPEMASPDCWFVFLSTAPFCSHPNVRFIPTTDDMGYIDRFILTCDAMLHARSRGETFGVSCAQFNAAGRMVLSLRGSPERGHFWLLGVNIVPYGDEAELRARCDAFTRERPRAVDVVTAEYSAEKVMRKFEEVFLR